MAVSEFLRTSLILFLVALGLIVLWQMYTGNINSTGLLRDKRTGAFSPGRLQLLLTTLAGLAVYAQAEMGNAEADLPDWLVWGMTGSQGVYLAGKSASHLGGGLLSAILRGKT